MVLLAGGGCGPFAPGPIAVFCSPDSPRLRQALEGLNAALDQGPLEVVCVPEFGDQGEEQLRRLRQQRPRLLVVLGTAALIRVAPVEKSRPVVFALVANPYFTGAAYEPQHPEIHQENLTGIFSPPPLTQALQKGAALLGPGTWGMLYDPNDGTAVELAARFVKEAPGFGLKPLIEEGVDAATDGQGLQNLLARGAKVIYLPPTASSQRYAETLLAWGRQLKVLVVSSLPEGPRKGAVLWVALDYRRLGEEAGALARRVLKGEAPAKIPLTESAPLKVGVDEGLLARGWGYPAPLMNLNR
jgi:putative ABC transport system substrate-binding protein